jgi:hypothetical protein
VSARSLAQQDVVQLSAEPTRSILHVLRDAKVAFWMHDVSECLSVIETVALQQFRFHKNAIDVSALTVRLRDIHVVFQVFLELTLAGQQAKLLQLAKTDRTIIGKQLCSLLSMEFHTEKGRNAARKNAFALIRLQRYSHAVATFLSAQPPLLKEACNVLVRYCEDAPLAFLVARLVESAFVGPPHDDGKTNGLFLGPVARGILIRYLLPKEGAREATKAGEPEKLCFELTAFMLLQQPNPCKDSVARLCRLAENELVHDFVLTGSPLSSVDKSLPAEFETDVDSPRSPLGVPNVKRNVHRSLYCQAAKTAKPLMLLPLADLYHQSCQSLFHFIHVNCLFSTFLVFPDNIASNTSVLGFAVAIDSLLAKHGLTSDRELLTRFVAAFWVRCGSTDARREWGPQHYTAYCAALLANSELSAKNTVDDGPVEDIDANNLALEDSVLLSRVDTPVVLPKHSGFNMAYVPKPLTTSKMAQELLTPKSALDWVDTPGGLSVSSKHAAATDATVSTPEVLLQPSNNAASLSSRRETDRNGPRSALDAFDLQPVRRRTEGVMATPSKAFINPGASSAPNAMDAFDYQPRRSEARSPVTRVRCPEVVSSGQVPSALDMFDYPPRRTDARNPKGFCTTSAENTNPFDMLELQATTPAASPPYSTASTAERSALDMFDYQPPRRITSSAPPATLVATTLPPRQASIPNALDMFDYQPRRK